MYNEVRHYFVLLYVRETVANSRPRDKLELNKHLRVKCVRLHLRRSREVLPLFGPRVAVRERGILSEIATQLHEVPRHLHLPPSLGCDGRRRPESTRSKADCYTPRRLSVSLGVIGKISDLTNPSTASDRSATSNRRNLLHPSPKLPTRASSLLRVACPVCHASVHARRILNISTHYQGTGQSVNGSRYSKTSTTPVSRRGLFRILTFSVNLSRSIVARRADQSGVPYPDTDKL